MKRLLILGSIMGLLVATTVWAGSLTVPNTFVGGQKALASEVNENFDEVEAQVTDNADNISSNADSITAVKGQLSDKLDALSCSDGQVLKYNAGTGSYDCADDLDTTDATALEGRPASDFADSIHQHSSTENQQLIDAICHLSKVTKVDLLDYDYGAYCSQYVFVTSTTHTGELGGVPVADDICQSLADSANLPGSYIAWLAASGGGSYAPANNIYKSPYPYILVDGTLVASSWGDLTDGSLINPINIDENGNIITTDTDVWTNVATTGAIQDSNDAFHCNEWLTGSAAVNGIIGSALNVTSEWTYSGYTSCPTYNRLYCIQR